MVHSNIRQYFLETKPLLRQTPPKCGFAHGENITRLGRRPGTGGIVSQHVTQLIGDTRRAGTGKLPTTIGQRDQNSDQTMLAFPVAEVRGREPP
jgi:hypothetical protein